VVRYRFGEIVWTRISDGHGNSKPRPALVISGSENNEAGEDLQVLAISTTPGYTCPPYHIEIPAHPPWHKLDPGSRVKCDWMRDVPQRDVIRSLGMIDSETLGKAVEWYERLYYDESFDDEWQ
jgi:mRNA-degrading endonuclease toxin of MazEF toxin-antitoxin module